MTLEDVRTEIQDIDLQLLRLMKRRLELAKLVGEDKASRNAAVRNIPQENKVIDRYRGFALENGMNPVYAEQVCRVLMQESIEIQAAMPRPSSRIRHIAIVGGYGKMGRWFADLLKDAGHRVDIIDPSSGNGLVIEDAKWADSVIVSVPISRTGSVLKKLDEICRPETLIFDVASLKSPFIDVLKDMGSAPCTRCSGLPRNRCTRGTWSSATAGRRRPRTRRSSCWATTAPTSAGCPWRTTTCTCHTSWG